MSVSNAANADHAGLHATQRLCHQTTHDFMKSDISQNYQC